MNQFRKHANRLCLMLVLTGGMASCKPQKDMSPAASVLDLTAAVATTTLIPPTPVASLTIDPKEIIAVTTSHTPVPPPADLVIIPGIISQPSSIQVGQILGVSSPDNSTEWQIAYSPSHLLALTPRTNEQTWPVRLAIPGACAGRCPDPAD